MVPDTTEPSIYSPLRHDDSIRLFKLHPAKHNGPITGDLIEVRLSDSPQYDCISYTWGSEVNSVAIRVSRIKILIRKNLHACLSRMRTKDDVQPLWIDALCISQTDLVEKAAQVQRIGTTFSKAAKVRVWLGHPALPSTPWRALQRLWGSHGTAAFDSSAHLKMMVRHTYWNRTWIMQELALAQSIELWNCCSCLTWDAFMEEVRDHGDRFEITAKDAANIWKVNGDRYDRYERKFSDNIIGSGKSFWGLIYSYSDTQCFNLRDKIYAVMSLERSDPSLSPIPVDYTIDMDELFWRIMVLRPVTTPLHGPFARIGTLAAALSLDASSLSKIRTKLEGGTDGIDPQSDWGGQLRRFLDSDDSDSDNST